MINLYPDTSFLNRPFDDPVVGANKLEAGVLFMVVDWVLKGSLSLISSSAIAYENSLNPFPERRLFVEKLLALASQFQNLDESVHERALSLEHLCGLQAIDALHLASAETAEVDFFVTCDYSLVKKYSGGLKAVTPIQFIKHYYENTT